MIYPNLVKINKGNVIVRDNSGRQTGLDETVRYVKIDDLWYDVDRFIKSVPGLKDEDIRFIHV